ncbi:ATP phosphoribosyltransferase regulatory subunit [Corynebacterium felinum]|uniref:Histidyl-tRNA synthetase n=1 Tax=Corynebacterium felinum TaxID=131318 RepID=A0ABU2B7P1_9CORY|nr:ATP phosphoribosyltransferase regulatory subunit [Corynebacterium felinum]MDF5820354.1 ATP phosphoribosyltransferase regulatory subunit [Corynebacterium felinum]MDR7354426.1 histidyl-tRNA synthetase [Corynebacterium felinum]WJY93796.1 Histidine--tRNA ligase [Corynebacterium felinum]
MKGLPGFGDRYGHELRSRRFLCESFANVSESYGFEPLSVSLLERAAAYSEEVIGLSPWPEWDKKSCFFIPIDNYTSSYSEQPEKDFAVLIPEGTVSVARWLGNELKDSDIQTVSDMRIKIYYDTPCFRNEVLDSLWAGKGRSFTQFGVEILGGGDPASDLEPLVLAYNCLKSVGVPADSIVLRISNNEIFIDLANQSQLSEVDRVKVKEALDTIAECKAGKKPERYDSSVRALLEIVSANTSNEGVLAAWRYIINRPVGPISREDYSALDLLNTSSIAYLDALASSMLAYGIQAEVDLCVVRSHEYYTGFTFEIDVIGQDGKRHVEVGGGGRYDRLLGDFAPKGFPELIPSTGFAFGIERLQESLRVGGYIPTGSIQRTTRYDLNVVPAIENIRVKGDNPREICENYLAQTRKVEDRRTSQRISILHVSA